MKRIALVGLGMAAGAGAAFGVISAQGAQDSPAYRQLDIFAAAFERVRANYVRPVQDRELIDGAIQGMLSKLDPHSSYMDAKAYRGDFQRVTRGEFGGVGVQIMQEDGLIKVISPMDGMPASKAGIKANDKITAIDGIPVLGEELQNSMDRMRGAAGSNVTLTVVRNGQSKPFDVMLQRANVPVDADTWRREGDIGYIRLPGFNEHTAPGLEMAVRELKKQIGPGIRGYVIDLRNNPGGLVDQAIQVSDDFLDSGEIVATRGRHPEDTQRYDAKNGDIADGKPVVVLINAGSASASEIVSGALQDHKRATIIGMTSFGKGSVQTVIPLNEGALRLTTARYYTPSGHSIQARGIIPDIQVAQGDEATILQALRPSEADLEGHLAGEDGLAKQANAPVISPAPGKKYDDFQLAYTLDLLRGKMSVATATADSHG